MMHSWIVAAALALSLGAAQAAIKEEPVEYKDKDTTMKGVIVYDDASQSRRPGGPLRPALDARDGAAQSRVLLLLTHS